MPVSPTTAMPGTWLLSPLKTPEKAPCTVSPTGPLTTAASTGVSVVVVASQTGACVTALRVMSRAPALVLNDEPPPGLPGLT